MQNPLPAGYPDRWPGIPLLQPLLLYGRRGLAFNLLLRSDASSLLSGAGRDEVQSARRVFPV